MRVLAPAPRNRLVDSLFKVVLRGLFGVVAAQMAAKLLIELVVRIFDPPAALGKHAVDRPLVAPSGFGIDLIAENAGAHETPDSVLVVDVAEVNLQRLVELILVQDLLQVKDDIK